ncbi:MAG: dTDP-4-dehydrorhamnose 3,5-epimerase family protein [Candidatus Roizmanbacteria bacterium]|nr:dTDP-4-dehydrorhamnose 3,5-epimerase family protein [Candidatus Roizmanbacteria bacterium]
MANLTLNDILTKLQKDVFVQDYSKKQPIEGVKIVEVKRMAGEDGTFEDLLRLDETGHLELFPEIQVRQINRSKLLPGSIKAWHLHFNQEDVWYIAPEDHMILGLWDTRENSATKDKTMKVVMGNGTSKLVVVPRGVAHGVVNVASTPGSIFYFVNNQFKLTEADERRLKWDALGASFWEVEKG